MNENQMKVLINSEHNVVVHLKYSRDSRVSQREGPQRKITPRRHPVREDNGLIV